MKINVTENEISVYLEKSNTEQANSTLKKALRKISCQC